MNLSKQLREEYKQEMANKWLSDTLAIRTRYKGMVNRVKNNLSYKDVIIHWEWHPDNYQGFHNFLNWSRNNGFVNSTNIVLDSDELSWSKGLPKQYGPNTCQYVRRSETARISGFNVKSNAGFTMMK